MQTEYWFRPKRRGYGAQPANWKGWLAKAVYLTAMGALTFSTLRAAALDGGAPPWVVLCIGMLLLTTLFSQFARARTDGEWRWRTGKETEETERAAPNRLTWDSEYDKRGEQEEKTHA